MSSHVVVSFHNTKHAGELLEEAANDFLFMFEAVAMMHPGAIAPGWFAELVDELDHIALKRGIPTTPTDS